MVIQTMSKIFAAFNKVGASDGVDLLEESFKARLKQLRDKADTSGHKQAAIQAQVEARSQQQPMALKSNSEKVGGLFRWFLAVERGELKTVLDNSNGVVDGTKNLDEATRNKIATTSLIGATVCIDQWNCKPELSLIEQNLSPENTDIPSVAIQAVPIQEVKAKNSTSGNHSSFTQFSEAALQVVAANANTPPRTLCWLASHPSPEIRITVAANKNALPETIWLLARDYDEAVRLSMAENPNAKEEILKALSHDQSSLVAWRAKHALGLSEGIHSLTDFPSISITASLNCSDSNLAQPEVDVIKQQETVIKQQDTDDQTTLLRTIAASPNTPSDQFAELARHSNSEIRLAVAQNPHISLEAIWLLAKDEVAAIRVKLAENGGCPLEVIESLQKDKDPYVVKRVCSILAQLNG